MKDTDCVAFLQWALPHLHMRWPGFLKVRKQVCKRISRRMVDLGLSSATTYREFLEMHPDEWEVLDSFCRITISRFYRDRSVFEYLGSEILPGLAEHAADRGRTQVRCWCIGCASGEEVYTLKMVWLHNARRIPRGAELQILATDINPVMLERAQRGIYATGSLKDLPLGWQDEYFESIDGLFGVRAEVRNGIEFRQQDIRVDQPSGPFDMVLCRNLVFTYFDEDLQTDILQILLNRLAPDGVLVAGKQEPAPIAGTTLVETAPHAGVYRRA